MDVLQFEAGPWKKIIDSNFEGFPVYIYQNPNKWALVVIFEQEKGETKNLITQIYAPFTGPISLLDLSNKIKADSIAYTKNISGKTFNYLIINSGITSIPFSAAEFKANVREQVIAVKENIRQVNAIAKTAEIALHPINEANNEIAANFFGEPILSAILSTSNEVRIGQSAVKGSILLGID